MGFGSRAYKKGEVLVLLGKSESVLEVLLAEGLWHSGNIELEDTDMVI